MQVVQFQAWPFWWEHSSYTIHGHLSAEFSHRTWGISKKRVRSLVSCFKDTNFIKKILPPWTHLILIVSQRCHPNPITLRIRESLCTWGTWENKFFQSTAGIFKLAHCTHWNNHCNPSTMNNQQLQKSKQGIHPPSPMVCGIHKTWRQNTWGPERLEVLQKEFSVSQGWLGLSKKMLVHMANI